MKAKLMLVLLPVFLASGACGGGEDVERVEEEAGVEEVVAEETSSNEPTPPTDMEKGPPETPEVFEGEHVDLEPGDTAVWLNGMELTISDVYITPNESKALRQKAEARDKENREKGKEPPPGPKSKAEDEPDDLVVYHWVIENNGAEPIRFNSDFPCEFLDENGVALRNGGTTAEQMRQHRAKGPRPLEQTVEPGQRREDVGNVAPPTEGTTIEIVCIQPPRAGGGPGRTKVAQARNISRRAGS
jgi:hypothetical protein